MAADRTADRARGGGLGARLRGLLGGAEVPGFAHWPEPGQVGSARRGGQLAAGVFQFTGGIVEAPGATPWEIAPPSPLFEQDLHGFLWLDDLAAVGDDAARDLARRWVAGWIARYGRGGGPGWRPDVAGRRVLRLLAHAHLLLDDAEADGTPYFRTLQDHAQFLARRWQAAPPILPRIEALVALARVGLALEGAEAQAGPALEDLDRELARRVDGDGAIASRNPEEMLEILALVAGLAAARDAAGQPPAPGLEAAAARMAATLRRLRHADGALARFHGGGRGAPGRLDHALATLRLRPAQTQGRASGLAGRAMGYARLAAGRTTLILDAAPPPPGTLAHASTLAFELTSARRPVIVNAGAGEPFGPSWGRTGRAPSGHSTLEIEEGSHRALARPAMAHGRAARQAGGEPRPEPRDVRLQASAPQGAQRVVAGHDGYVAAYGLTHLRMLTLSRDGRRLSGRDTLGPTGAEERATFAAALRRRGLRALPFALRFHLHPDVEAEAAGGRVWLTLLSGEVWIFEHDGPGAATLEPSVYLEAARPRPVGTRQIVLAGAVDENAGQVGWTLSKAEDTPRAIRDHAAAEDDTVLPVPDEAMFG